ncbi:MAG TPA: GYF domain-containing protein [Polyangiaceae bacterium]|jgi:uncharacterized protein DUF4339|nr:GYF domain-containing protein [Polyangiaceae bacterium]
MTIDEDDAAATHLYSSEHPMNVEWSVNVSDDDTRSMTAVEIAYQFLQGKLDNADTFVWREGMEDWIPLGDCYELQATIRDYQAGQPSKPSSMRAPSSRSPSSARAPSSARPVYDDDFGGTLPVHDHDPYASEPYAEEPFANVRPQAAVAQPGSRPPESHRRVGQRNEESSLFSLDALASMHESAAAKAPPPGSKLPQPSKSTKKKEGLDDIFGLGGGGFGGGGFAANFAPPPLNAPPPPPPPKPKSIPPAPLSASPVLAPMHFAHPPRRSNVPLVIGIVAVVVLIAGVGIGFYAASGDETGATAQLEGKDEEDKSGDKDDKAKDEDKKDDDEKTAAKDEDKKDDKSPSTTPSGKTPSPTSKTDSKDEKKTASKDDEEKKDEKKDEKKGGAEFDVNAARSALGGAAGAASGCGKPGGPTGKGRVSVTFAPSGRATTAVVGPPFAGTPVGSCAAAAFKRASVPPFSGGPVTVQKSFFIQ